MTVPQYANGETYKKLVDLCEAAGVPVSYGEVDDDAYAQTQEYFGIQMPDDDRLESEEHAMIILGHELGHHLLREFYFDNKFVNPDANRAMEVMVESQCNIAGVILFKLAEMIAGHEAESIFRDIASVQEGGA